MRDEGFEFISNLDTLWAVALGAILATFGGVVATHLEWRIDRKRRERDAARFFGEVLSSIDLILDRAAGTKKIGDPYGPVTMRFLRTARREIEVYERNRERLFDIGDLPLRARVHFLLISKTMPLEAVIESTEDIERIEDVLKSASPPPEARVKEMEARLVMLRSNRDLAFDLLDDAKPQTEQVLKDLGRIGGVDFTAIGTATTPESVLATPAG